MKQSALLIICCLLTAQLFGQSAINRFYNKYKFDENTTKVSLPGWLIKIGAGVAKKHVDNEEEKAALDLAKHIRKMKVLVMEDGHSVDPRDVKKMVRKARAKHNFSDLISVRSADANVNIMIREKKDKIKNMLVVVEEENEFVLLSLKTSLKIEDLNHFIHSLQKDKQIKLEIPLPEEVLEDEPAPPVLWSQKSEVRGQMTG